MTDSERVSNTQYSSCKHAIHCFEVNLVYHHLFSLLVGPESLQHRRHTCQRYFIQQLHRCPLLTLSGRVIWIFPNVMHWTRRLRTVTRKLTTSVEVVYGIQCGTNCLVLLACLLPTTLASAIAMAAAGFATSSSRGTVLDNGFCDTPGTASIRGQLSSA